MQVEYLKGLVTDALLSLDALRSSNPNHRILCTRGKRCGRLVWNGVEVGVLALLSGGCVLVVTIHTRRPAT